MKAMLKENNVLEKLQVIVRDSGTNMVAGFRDANLPSLPCLAHIIQNVINCDALGEKNGIIGKT